MSYTITIIDLKPVPEIDGLPGATHAQFEISDGVDNYTYSVGNLPAGITEVEAQTELDNRAGELWPLAAAQADDADVLKRGRVELVLRAFALVVLDEINLLRVAMSEEPRTAAQLKTAVRTKMRELIGD